MKKLLYYYFEAWGEALLEEDGVSRFVGVITFPVAFPIWLFFYWINS